MKRVSRFGVVMLSLTGAVGGVMVAPTSILAHEQSAASAFTILTVRGESNVQADPDVAFVHVGAETRSDAAEAAATTNDAKAEKIVDAIKQLGVDPKSVRIRWPSVTPIYEKEEEFGPHAPQRGPIVGYRASVTIEAELSELGKVSSVVRAAMKSGATSVDSVWFELKNNAEAKDQAIAKAVAQARERASSVAAASNLQLLGIAAVSLDNASIQRASGFNRDRSAPLLSQGYDAAIEAKLLTLAPQQVPVTASVTIEYNASPR